MNKTVYVLVPVYNVEKVLRDTVESVINQTYKNWRMILVDDGSKDNSAEICDEFARKEDRISVIHQKNGGLSKARYAGIAAVEQSKNTDDTYLMFLDSDDLLPENAIEILYSAAEKYGCDIVDGSVRKFVGKKCHTSVPDSDGSSAPEIIEHDRIVSELYGSFFGYVGISVTLWAKLFRTEFFLKIYSTINEWPYYFGEDLNVTIRMVPEAEKIARIENVVYLYRDGGGTNRFMKSFLDDSIYLYKLKKQYADRYGVESYTRGLIDVEMKNMAMTYLVMCRRSRTYPHGTLKDEISYITGIPEFLNAVSSIPDTTLSRDFSEVPGFTQAFAAKDIEAVYKLVVKKAGEGRVKRFVKRILA